MLYISKFNEKINEKKPLFLSIIKIYGVGFYKSRKILQKSGLSLVKNSNYEMINKFFKEKFIYSLESYSLLGFKLRVKIYDNIQHLIKIKHYKGFRHSVGLPLNGQRTHNNRKTQRRLGRGRLVLKDKSTSYF